MVQLERVPLSSRQSAKHGHDRAYTGELLPNGSLALISYEGRLERHGPRDPRKREIRSDYFEPFILEEYTFYEFRFPEGTFSLGNRTDFVGMQTQVHFYIDTSGQEVHTFLNPQLMVPLETDSDHFYYEDTHDEFLLCIPNTVEICEIIGTPRQQIKNLIYPIPKYQD